jgi:hypothetical protein
MSTEIRTTFGFFDPPPQAVASASAARARPALRVVDTIRRG